MQRNDRILIFQLNTAVLFLRNSKVAKSSLLQKRNFLASKGLTDSEIQEAFERVGIFNKMDNDPNTETKINMNLAPATQISYKHQMTTFEKIKDVVSSVALLSGIAYGIYVFYKAIKK
jgi:peroxin-14